MNKKKIFLFLLILPLLSFLRISSSYSEETQNKVDEESEKLFEGIESIYDDFTKKKEKKEKKLFPKKSEKFSYKRVSDLIHLSSFKDIAVIQRRFFPKTHRYEFSVGGTFNGRNTFFNNFGAKILLGYYFSEHFGIAASYYQLTDSTKSVVERIREGQNLALHRFVRPYQYMGVNINWIPIYGKMTLINKSIIPFDMLFSLSLGQTTLMNKKGSVSAGVSVGQIFPFSKSLAFRWDFKWNFYKPKIDSSIDLEVEDQGNSNNNRNINGYVDLFFSMGVSFFFPGAKYR